MKPDSLAQLTGGRDCEACVSGISRRRLLAGGAAGLGVSGAAAGAVGAGWWQPFARDRVPEPVKTSGGNGMNVVLVVSDQVRADHVGAYGSSVRTPNIDAFAASGVRFTRPYSESMPTVPVRRAMLTGRRTFPFPDWEPWPELPASPGWGPIPRGQTTLAEMLGQVGYTRVALSDTPYYFNASMNLARGFEAFDWVRGQGFDAHGLAGAVSGPALARYLLPAQRDPSWIWHDHLRRYLADALSWQREQDWPVAQLCSNAAHMLSQLRDIQPFLLLIDTFETHGPFFPPAGYAEQYGEYDGEVEPIQPSYGSSDYLTEAQIARTDQLYSGEITFTDRWLGRIFDALDEHGLWENTLVFVLTDHGMQLGGEDDHRLIGKIGSMLLPSLTDTIMMMRHPEKGHGETSDVFAGSHDITPTVLANLDIILDQPLDGADLLDPGSAAAERNYATSIYGSTLWARDTQHTLLAQDYGGVQQLYDHNRDPHFTQDLAGSYPDKVRHLWTHIRADANGHIPQYD